MFSNVICEMSDDDILDEIQAINDLLDFDDPIKDIVDKKSDLSFLSTTNLSMTANKVFFRREEQGVLAGMMEHLYDQRKTVKKQMLQAESDVEIIKGILKERGVKS